ncbi:MAG: FCD domain-containing protein [Gaiellales bacterium]
MGDPKPSFGAVRAESLPDVVRRELETAIEEERLLPGDRLPSERELAEQFDVSRIVVREALRGLEATNTIEIQRNRGAFVRRRPSQGVREQWAAWLAEHNVEVVEILRIRRALEALAAGEAARQARRADVADLRRLCKAFDRELASGDPDVARLVELDIEFHRLIGRTGGGALLPHIVDELVGVLRDPPATFSAPGRGEVTAADHRAILGAVERHDPEGATAAMETHLDHVIEIVRSLTKSTRRRG